VLGDERFVCAPDRLHEHVDRNSVFDLRSLVAILDDEVERVVGEARLAYADDTSLRLVATDGVVRVDDDDARLAGLEAVSDPAEWSEASVDEPCEQRLGVVERGALVAISTVQVWADALGQISVFTAAPARGRGLGARAGVSYAPMARSSARCSSPSRSASASAAAFVLSCAADVAPNNTLATAGLASANAMASAAGVVSSARASSPSCRAAATAPA
jgi:hypothetical protein